jgi:transposase-like protein
MSKSRAKKKSNNHGNGKYEYRVISNCPVCKGAVFPNTNGNKEMRHLYKCLQCSRYFTYENDGQFRLFARRAKPILTVIKGGVSSNTNMAKSLLYLYAL